MKNYSFVLTFFIFSIAFSQTIYEQSSLKMFWGQEVISHHQEQKVQIIGKDTNYYLLVDGKIEKYNQNFQLIKSEKVNLSYKKYKQELESIEYINDSLYLFTSYINRKLKLKFLFVQKIDKNTLKSSQQLQKIAEIEVKNPLDPPHFYFKFSEETQLIYYVNSVKQKSSKIGVFVYNHQFDLLWKKENLILEDNYLIKVEDVYVDEEANVHFVNILHQEQDFKKYKNQFYEYQLVSFFDKGEIIKKDLLQFCDKKITHVKMKLNKNNNLVLIGFYFKKEEEQGTFYLKLNKNSHQVVLTKFNELSKDFFKMPIYEELLTLGHAPIFDYLVKNIYVQDNGETTLLLEQHYVLEQIEHYPPSRMLRFFQYHYNDLILFHYDIQGELIWKTQIPKHQLSHNDGGYFLSVASLLSNDSLYLFYNDHQKKSVFSTILSHSKIVFAEIDLTNGHYQKDFFEQIKRLDVFIVPKQSRLIEDELIMLGKKGRHHRLLKIQRKSFQ